MISGSYEKIEIDMASNEARFQNSEYAQVIFQNIGETYPTEAHIECNYLVTSNLTPTSHDWVGLYKVGWSSPKEYCYFEWAPLPQNDQASVLFPAHKLPAEDGEFYQFCYVTSGGQVRGASIPFQFKATNADDFVEVIDDDNDMMIIKHRTIVLEEDLQRAQQLRLGLLKDKSLLEVERDSLICKLIDLEKSLKQEKTKNTELETKLKESSATLEGEVREITALNESLKEKIAARNQEMQEVVKRLEENECYITSLQDKIKSLVQEKDTLTGRNKALEEEKEMFKNHFSTSEEAIVAYQHEVVGLKKQVTDMEKSITTTQGQIDELEKALGEKQKSLQKQVSLTEKSAGVVSNMEEQLKNMEERLSAAEECKKLINDELTNVQQAHDKMASELEKSKSDEHHLKMQLSQMEMSQEEKEAVWAVAESQLQKQLADTSKNVEEKGSELTEALRELETFQSQKREEEGPLYALRVAHDHLKDKCAKLQAQMEAKEKHFEEVMLKQKKWCESRVEQELRAEIDELKQRLEMAAAEYATKYRECRALQKKLSKRTNAKEAFTVLEPKEGVKTETIEVQTADDIEEKLEEAAAGSTHDQSVQMEASVADLSNTELQAQLDDLAQELDKRHQKKEQYKQKWMEEKEKNAFLQKHYHDELRKKDETIDEIRRQLRHESVRLQSVDSVQQTIQKERLMSDQATITYPPSGWCIPSVPMSESSIILAQPLTNAGHGLPLDDGAPGLAKPLAPLPPPLAPYVLPTAKVAQVKLVMQRSSDFADFEAPIEPPVEPPLQVQLPSENATDSSPNAHPAEDEFQDAPSEPYKECPICRMEFPPDTREEVVNDHVEQHLEKDKNCPMCGLIFIQGKQQEFEQHVQSHFDTE